MQALIIVRPDDMHLHLHDGNVLKTVAPYTARQMGRAVIMPNLKLPAVNIADVQACEMRIMTALPEDGASEPLITFYLTDNAAPELAREVEVVGIVASKLYPVGATTNSDSGVIGLFKSIPLLEEMAKRGILPLIHGEVTDPEVDIFDHRVTFTERMTKPILTQVPDLKVVLEHIITAEIVRPVLGAGDNVAASVTPQHLLPNRNDLLVGGVRPHRFHLPVLKRETRRQALIIAVTSGKAYKFFLGTDSVPHAKATKGSARGCADMFNAMIAIELYAEVPERAGALDELEAFASQNGPRFYGLPENSDTITLVKQTQTAPAGVSYGDGELIPIRTDGEIEWTVQY